MRVLVFDTETTGLPKSRKAPITDSEAWPHIVQLSWIVYDTEAATIESAEDHLVKLPSGMSIPPESARIHGITDSQLNRKGIDAGDALQWFVRCVSGADMYVAHNIDFDRPVIQAACSRLGLAPPFDASTCRARSYCTAKAGVPITQLWAKRANGTGFLRYPKLWELHQELFQTDVQNLHDALADVLVCLRCYLAMAHDHDLMGCRGARKLFELYRIGSNKPSGIELG